MLCVKHKAIIQDSTASIKKGSYDLRKLNDGCAACFFWGGQIDYLNEKLSSRIKNKIANYFGARFFDSMIEKRQLILKEVRGIENFTAVKGGKIVTCNHFYQKIKVKKWKDRVWELGGLGGFSERNLEAPGCTAYIAKFIIECNKGVLTHRLSYFIGFLPMGFLPRNCALSIALPVATVNLFLNVLPTLVLRYNTPKRKRMLQRMERKNIITG